MSKTLSRSSSLGGLSDNSFNLQGFESERVELDKLIVIYKDKIDSYAQTGNFSIENLLACPLGVSYFYKFLSEEFNKENILAYYELKSLIDYLLYSKKKMDWVIDTSDIYRDDISDVSSVVSANSSFVSNANSEQSVKYVNAVSVDEIRECFKRIQQFKKSYFDSSSLYEINISSSMKKKVLESLSFTKEVQEFINNSSKPSTDDNESTNSQVIEDTLGKMYSNLNTIQSVLEDLKTDLLHNLSDPFQRFTSSDEMYECMALFLSSQGDDTYHRERVLNANKGEGVVLNQPEGHLAIIGKTMSDLQVVHPITKVTELLEALLSVIQADTKFFRKTTCESNESESVIELNFDELGKSENCCSKFEKFQHQTFDLAHCDLTLLKSDEEKLTFFINAYNLLLLHALLVSGSMPQVEVTNIIFYRKVRYNLGGQEYSLQDIFNGILQCNQMKCLIYGKAFKKNDARKANIPSKTFPEVYFGLINMTKYSPKLRVYEPTSLLDKLKENTKDYFDRYVQVLPSDQHPTELLEIALPSQLKEHKYELKNFWKSDVTTVIKSVNNLSTASFNSSSQSLTSFESRASMDSSSLSDASTSRSLSSAEADIRKNVLDYLMETYHPELVGGKHELANKTKYTYKKYDINPPNWFTVFNETFQQAIIEQFQVQIPAAGEILLPKKAKENNCPIASLFSKFSRTSHLCENASKVIAKEEVSSTKSSDESPTLSKKLFGRGRSSCTWKKKSFKKKEVSVVDFLLGRKKDKVSNKSEKKNKACVIA